MAADPMRCADCPELGDTGTRKREVCCLRDGRVRQAAEKVSKAFGGRPSASAVEAQIADIVLGPERLTASDFASDSNAAMSAAALREVVPPGTPLNNRRERRRAAKLYGRPRC